MKIFFINNDGAGFADHIHIDAGTTVERLFQQRMHGAKASDYLIRVNRQPTAADQVLQENDRVSITALKIHGAYRGIMVVSCRAVSWQSFHSQFLKDPLDGAKRVARCDNCCRTQFRTIVAG